MKFRNTYSASEDMPSPVGEPIYKWEYFGEDGEIVTDERNVYEMIQSFEPQTKYKEIIEEYGMDTELLDGRPGAIYGDTAQFGSNIDDFSNRLRTLYQELEQALAYVKPREAVLETGVQGEEASETTNEVSTKTGVK